MKTIFTKSFFIFTLWLGMLLLLGGCSGKESPEPEIRGVLADFLAARPKVVVQPTSQSSYGFDQVASERGYAFTAERNATITHLGLRVAQPGTYRLHLSEESGFFNDYVMFYNGRLLNNDKGPTKGRLAWLEVQVTEPDKFTYVKLPEPVRTQAGQHYILTHTAPNHNAVLDAGLPFWLAGSSENTIALPTKLTPDFTLKHMVYIYFNARGQAYAAGPFNVAMLRGLVDFAYTVN
jgi:hypothetical protein